MIYETYLGPPDFGPRKGAGIIILHTTESAGTTLASAKQLAALQANGTLKGSYNKIICSDGVLTTVPDDHISGGVNPFSSYWEPEAWLYQMLPAFMVNDPNSYALELSFMGTKATYDANGWPSQMIDAAARLILAEEARIGKSVVVTNHEDYQTNRSDAGVKATDLVMARYHAIASTGDLPDTSLPSPEESMTIVTLTMFPEPRAVSFAAGSTVAGYLPSTSAIQKSTTFTSGSAAHTDARAVITQDPLRAPNGTFYRIVDGIYKDLYVLASAVLLEPAPAPVPLDCTAAVAAATTDLQSQLTIARAEAVAAKAKVANALPPLVAAEANLKSAHTALS